ncbi:hypothetical protein Dole_2507 [Desulfosudis oleivorans Hxd3]|uniref:Uncharacterized protein n=1 Tax=Desulfosudis oleivorans (strain DSM 6200 / JCM 39069 / Hxd3) TaxID=96561 RepID=A8ZW77_DESOH|nr:hypothetical protein Dole_2507 [Desulfosudis oleivorans Hxd3]
MPAGYNKKHKWIGEKIIFLTRYESVQEYGYQNYSYRENSFYHPSYKKLVGKVGEIIGAKEGYPTKFILKLNDSNKILYTTAYGNSLNDIAFLSEMDNAKKFIGKTVWNKRHPTDASADRHGYIRCQRTINKFEKLTITNVKWGYGEHSPLRFFFRTEDGVEGYWDGSFSRINDSSNHLLQPFEENWYFEDPHAIYPDWPKKTWDAIEAGNIFIGMTDEQASLSWGKPNKINKTVGSWGVHEQWIYNNQYLYFENGRLESFQSY